MGYLFHLNCPGYNWPALFLGGGNACVCIHVYYNYRSNKQQVHIDDCIRAISANEYCLATVCARLCRPSAARAAKIWNQRPNVNALPLLGLCIISLFDTIYAVHEPPCPSSSRLRLNVRDYRDIARYCYFIHKNKHNIDYYYYFVLRITTTAIS